MIEALRTRTIRKTSNPTSLVARPRFRRQRNGFHGALPSVHAEDTQRAVTRGIGTTHCGQAIGSGHASARWARALLRCTAT
jgi:hypothetical protein